jgi:hypothetical protein
VDSASVDIQSKIMCIEVAKVMVQQLAIYANAGFQHLLTGDKSWMASDYMPL